MKGYKHKYLIEIGGILDKYKGAMPFPPKVQKRVDEIVEIINPGKPKDELKRDNTRNIWTEKEVNFLIEHHEMNLKKLHELFNETFEVKRTYRSVYNMVLRLRRDGDIPPWSIGIRRVQIEKQLDFIAANKHLTLKQISKELGIPEGTVSTRRWQLKQRELKRK